MGAAIGALRSNASTGATSSISKGATAARGSASISVYTQASPHFIDAPGPAGKVIPIPTQAKGPLPNINAAGKKTGFAFTGGKGGKNGQVSSVRIMNPVPARGNAPSYPKCYVKYENSRGQGVDPYTGRTLSHKNEHFSLE